MPSGNVSRGTETSEYLALTLALDEVDDLNGGLGDVGHVLAVRELAEERRRSNDDIDTVDTCGYMLKGTHPTTRERQTSLDGYPRIIHMATNVSENLGLQTELADSLAICW